MPLSAMDNDLINNASEGNFIEVRDLLSAGANVNAKDADGKTALYNASHNGHVEVVRELIHRDDVDVNARMQYVYDEDLDQDVDEDVDEDFDEDVDEDAHDADGETALMVASRKGHSEVVRALLKHYLVDVNATNADGKTALHIAIEEGYLEVVSELLVHDDVDVNVKDVEGATALMVASSGGHLDVVRALLKHDTVDVNAQDAEGATALVHASFHGRVKVVKELLQNTKVNVNAQKVGSPTALHDASLNGHLEVVSLLLQCDNMDVNAKNYKGKTALHIASEEGHVEVVKKLLQNSKVNTKVKDNDGSTAFQAVEAMRPAKYSVVSVFEDHETALKAAKGDRALLANVMTAREAQPVELSYQYINRYTTSRKLGSGASCDVFLAQDSDLPEPKKFAVKMIKLSERFDGPNDKNLESFQKELSTLKRFRHPNIIVLYGYNLNVDLEQQFLVYEYAANGSLDGFLKDEVKRADLPAATRLSIMYNVARAVYCLHTGAAGFKVFHRDIKSANICLTEDFTPRLIDCGLAKFVEDEHNAFPSATIIQTGSTKGPAFGTPGYMCPEYISKWAQKWAQQIECDYIPSYDVYSLGVVMAELILGKLNAKPTNVFQTYVLKENTPVVDGWKQLKDDADNKVTWNADALEVVCMTAIGCITPSSEGRLSTIDLLDLLKHAINKYGGKSDVEPESPKIDKLNSLLSKIRLKAGTRNSEPEGDHCVLCNLNIPVVECKGEARHPLCAGCIEVAVWDAPASTTASFQLSCLKLECSSQPFMINDLPNHIRSRTLTILSQKSNERRLDEVMELQKSTQQGVDEIKDVVKTLASVIDRHLPGWALQAANAEQLKLCPTVMVITPSAVDNPVDIPMWFKNVKEQKYKVTFYCEHSGDAGHEPFEISVDKQWFVTVVPWLQSVINIATALAQTNLASALVKEFPLPKHSKEMKALIEALGDEEQHDQTQTLEGDAFKAIREMAYKKENLEKWKESMVAVVGTNGRTIWVKKEFETSYRLAQVEEEGVFSA